MNYEENRRAVRRRAVMTLASWVVYALALVYVTAWAVWFIGFR